MSALSIAVNENLDLYVGADGNLAMSSDLDACLQAAGHAARTLLSEMVYATDAGVPYFDVAWGGVPNLAQLEASLRAQIMSVDGVLQVPSITFAQADNTLTYTAEVHTIYGTGTITNG